MESSQLGTIIVVVTACTLVPFLLWFVGYLSLRHASSSWTRRTMRSAQPRGGRSSTHIPPPSASVSPQLHSALPAKASVISLTDWLSVHRRPLWLQRVGSHHYARLHRPESTSTACEHEWVNLSCPICSPQQTSPPSPAALLSTTESTPMGSKPPCSASASSTPSMSRSNFETPGIHPSPSTGNLIETFDDAS